MLYKDTLMKVHGGLTLYVPDPLRVKDTYERLLDADATAPFPFWAKIWPSAEAMATFLMSEPGYSKGKRVLELGAGIGLPSFVASAAASDLIISDHSPEAVALIKKNIQYLGIKNARAVCMDWNHLPDDLYADTVLLSDINYAPDQFPVLLAMIRKLLYRGTAIVLTTPQRITVTPFAEVLQPYIRHTELHTVMHGHEAVDIRLCVLLL